MATVTGSHVDLASRLSARAITVGVFVTLASARLLMVFGGAIGLWSFRPRMSPHELGAGFWIVSFIAWIVGTFFGGYIAAISARATARRDGLLHGLATWAIAAVLARVGLALAVRAFGFSAMESSVAMFWGIFLGDACGLVGGLLGGAAGVRSEGAALVGRRTETGAFTPTTPTPQPT
jgi:hypothetical protein